MEKSDEKQQTTTAHRKVKSSARSRKNLKRPTQKVLAESKKSTEKSSKPEKKAEVVDKSQAQEIKVKKNTSKKHPAVKSKKKTSVKVQKPESKAKKNNTSVKVEVKTADKVVEKPVEKIENKAEKAENKAAEKPVENKVEEVEVKIAQLTPINFSREEQSSKVLVRGAQYGEVEKRPLNDAAALKKPATIAQTPPKDNTEQIKVRKAEPEMTQQENLETQVEFWSNLASADEQKAKIVKQPTPEPVDLQRVHERMRARTNIPAAEQPKKVPAKKLKEQEIQKALRAAEKAPAKKPQSDPDRMRFTWGRIMLTLSCTLAAVAAIVYFVNLSAPDVSLKVAAMQSGIEATYPSYTPRDYNLSDITSEENKITLSFRSSDGTSTYTLTEEKSAWDSNALLTNYVKENYGDEYTAVREQGLTLYMMNNGAAWVNGGMLYKLKVNTGTLTKKQIKTIATSL